LQIGKASDQLAEDAHDGPGGQHHGDSQCHCEQSSAAEQPVRVRQSADDFMNPAITFPMHQHTGCNDDENQCGETASFRDDFHNSRGDWKGLLAIASFISKQWEGEGPQDEA